MTTEIARRIENLIAQMTLSEKLGQLTMLAASLVETGPPGPHNPATMVREGRAGSILNTWGAKEIREAQRVAMEETRLKIPLFFAVDVLHGHRTIYPIPLAEACAFDRALWQRTAQEAAEEATRDVEAWLKCQYMEGHIGDEFDGVITGVTNFGVFVQISDLMTDGLVHVTSLANDYYQYDAGSQRLIGERSGNTYSLGESMRVRVHRVDMETRRIDFRPVEGKRR